MPVIYSPRLAEIYRNAANRTSSILTSTPPADTMLTSDGNGATTWSTGGGTSNNPDLTVTNLTILNSLNSSSTFVNYLSVGNIVINTASFPQLNTNTLSTTTLTATTILARQLSTTTLSTANLYTSVANISSLQINTLSTGSLTLNSAVFSSGNTNSVSTLETTATTASASTLITNTVSTGVLAANTVRFVTLAANSTLTTSLSTNQISTISADVTTVSTNALLVSSLNNSIYPPISVIPQTISFSTVAVAQYTQASSTFTDSTSTATIFTNLATFSTLNTNSVSATSVNASTLTTEAVSTTTLSTGTLYSGLATVSTLNAQQITAQSTLAFMLHTSTINANTVSTGIGSIATVNTASLSTHTASVSSVTAATGLLNTLSTNLIQANQIQIAQGNFSTLAGNSVSTGIFGTAVATIPTVSVGSASAASVSTISVSSTQIQSESISTLDFCFSTLNGSIYPQLYATNTNLVLSSLTLGVSSLSASTFTNVLSTSVLYTGLVQSAAISTGTLSTGSLTLPNLNVNSFSSSNATISSLYMSTLKMSTLNTGGFNAQNINAANYANTTGTISSISAYSYIFADRMYAEFISAPTAEQTFLSANKCIVTTTITDVPTNFSSELSTGAIIATSAFSQTAALSTLSTAALTIGQFTATSVFTDELSSQTLQITAAASFQSRANTVSANTVAIDQLSARQIIVSSISTGYLQTSTAQISSLNANLISAASLRLPYLETSALSTATLSTGLAYFSSMYISSAQTNLLSTGTFSNVGATFTSLSTNQISTTQAFITTVNVPIISTGTLSTGIVSTSIVQATAISSAYVSTNQYTTTTANIQTLNTNVLSTGGITVTAANFNTFTATNLSTGSYRVAQVATFSTMNVTDTLSTTQLLTDYLSVGTLQAYGISTYSLAVWGPNTLRVQGSTVITGPVYASQPFTADTVSTQTVVVQSMLYTNTLTTTSTLSIDTATGPRMTLTGGQIDNAQVSTISSGTFAAKYTNISSVTANTVSSLFIYSENVIASSVTVGCLLSISTVDNVANVTALNLTANTAFINNISTVYISSGAISSGTAYTSSLTVNTISSGNAYVGATTADAMTLTALSTGVLRTADFRTGGLSTISTAIASLITGTSHSTSGLSTLQVSTAVITATTTTFVSLSTSVLSTGSVSVPSSIIASLSANTLTTDRITFRNGFGNLVFLSTNQVSSGTAYIGYAEAGTISVNSFTTQTVPATSLVVGGISTSLLSTNQFFINQTAFVSSVSTQGMSTGSIAANNTPFLPTSLSNLTQWLDSTDISTLYTNSGGTIQVTTTGQNVAFWRDKSGSNNNVLQNGAIAVPTYDSALINSRNALNFNPKRMLKSTTTPNKSLNVSFIMVAMVKNTIGQWGTFWGHFGGTDHDLNAITMRKVNGTTNINWHTQNDNTNTVLTYTADSPVIYTGTMTDGKVMFFQQFNNINKNSVSYTHGTASITTSAGNLWVGHDDTSVDVTPSSSANSPIGEILYYQRVLSQNEINMVQGYVAWKWGLEGVLPADHPYKSAAPGTLGNSLSAQINTARTNTIQTDSLLTLAPNAITEGINVSTFSTAQLTATAARIGFISTNRISTGQATATSLTGSSLTVGFVSTGIISTSVAVMDTAYISTLRVFGNANMSNANANISSLTVEWVLSTGSYAGPGITMGRSFGTTLSTGVATATELRTSSMNVDFVSTGRLVAFSTFANYVSAITATVSTLVSTSALYVSTINGAVYSGDGSVSALSLSSLTATNFSTSLIRTGAVSTNRLEVSGAANLQYTSSIINYLVSDYTSGYLWQSYDSINWAKQSINLGSGDGAYGIAWNGQYWLASFKNNWTSTIRKSIDGINWTTTTGGFANSVSSKYCFGFAWNNSNRWVAVGDAPTSGTASVECIKYSTDGNTWTNSTGDSLKIARGVAYGNNMWVSVGNYSSGLSKNTIVYSTNGTSWTYVTSGGFSTGIGYGGCAVTWGGNKWVAVGTGDTAISSIQYSYDGRNWINAGRFTTTIGGEYGTGYGVAWNGKLFIAVGTDEFNPLNTIQHSYDGISWRSSISGAFPSSLRGTSLNRQGGRSVCWDGKKWIAVGYGNGTALGYSTIQHSYDGSNWFVPALSITTVFTAFGIAYAQPAVPDINLGDLQIFGQGKPPSSIGVHNIYATYTTIAIDNTLYIDKYRSSVAINSELPVDIYNSTLKLYVSGIIQTYTVQAIKPGNKWSSASDERIKENIQLADLSSCYSTVKELNLYHYKYTNDYLSRVTVQDKSILGFIAQDMATVFPKSVNPMNVYGYENLLVMNQAQSEMAHYGATRHLMNKVDAISRQVADVANAQQPQTQDLYPVLSSFQTLESNLVTQSTLYGIRTNTYVSTLDAQTEQIQSLQTKFDELVSNISSLLRNN